MVSKEWRTLSNFYVRKTLPVAECGVHWSGGKPGGRMPVKTQFLWSRRGNESLNSEGKGPSSPKPPNHMQSCPLLNPQHTRSSLMAP